MKVSLSDSILERQKKKTNRKRSLLNNKSWNLRKQFVEEFWDGRSGLLYETEK